MTISRSSYLSAALFLAFALGLRAQDTQPGAGAVNLPVCGGSPGFDDTPGLINIIKNSTMNTFFVSPLQPCYVHFTGANGLPAGTRLVGTLGRSVLRLFTASDNLLSIGKSDITIEGLTLDNPFSSTTGYHGVLIWVNAQGFRLIHNKISSSAEGGSTGTAVWAWNSNVDIESNEVTDFGTQIKITATPGKEPRIRIIGNRLHDNNAGGGNGIVIASDNSSTKSDIPTTIEGNYIWNISASASSSGQNGNGVDLDHANNVRIANNHAKNVRFSCWRAFSSDSLLAEGNHCSDAGETGGYSEFNSLHNQWVNNYFDNIASGCLSLANSDVGGQYHTAIGNHMVGCGGTGIQAEAATIVEGNMIDQASTGMLLGYGSYGQHVIARDNYIMDTSGQNKTVRGIGIESRTSGDMDVEGNKIVLPGHQIEATAWGSTDGTGALPATVQIRDQEIPFAMLGVAANGSYVYCPDCQVGPVCAGGGQGAFAKRLQNIWICQ